MKITPLLLYLLFAFPTCNPASEQNGELVALVGFGDNPGNLKAWRYVPKALTDSAALLVVLHGCGQNAAEMARVSGWKELADQAGFAVLYPEQQIANNLQNCFNWFVPEDMRRESGEALSMQQMVQHSLDSLPIARQRVFVTGMSAGGAMAGVMLAAYPELFAAGGVIAGVPYGAGEDLATGLKAMQGRIVLSPEAWAHRARTAYEGYEGPYPHLAIFHGTDDPIVNPTNAEELAKQWAGLHGLDLADSSVVDSLANNPRVKRSAYLNSDSLEVLLRYDIAGLGHAIPVDPGEGEGQGGETGPYAKDVDFFSTYWIARFLGLLPE